MSRIIALLALLGCVATQATAQGDADLTPSAVAADIVRQTNAFRETQRLAPVTSNGALVDAAQEYAEYVARTDRFVHDADGSQPPDRARQHGYDFCILSENIGYQYRKPEVEAPELAQLLVQAWENSAIHRRNMLDGDVRDTGVGLARSRKSGRWYAVQLFGLPKDAQIRFQMANETPETIRYQLADRSFELGPRVTRTHLQCRDAEVSVALPGEPSKILHPKPGERYEVHRDDGRWDVVTQKATD